MTYRTSILASCQTVLNDSIHPITTAATHAHLSVRRVAGDQGSAIRAVRRVRRSMHDSLRWGNIRFCRIQGVPKQGGIPLSVLALAFRGEQHWRNSVPDQSHRAELAVGIGNWRHAE